MRALKIVAAALLMSVASCGGDEAALLIARYGNSADTGNWLDGGTLAQSSPTPTERINALSPNVQQVCHCINGLTLAELLAGGPVAMSVPPGLPVEALASQLQHDPARVVIIGLGEVEALFGAQAPEQHRADLDAAVTLVRAAGKEPRISGLIRFAPNALVTLAMIARAQQFDAARRAYAQANSLVFYDRAAVEFFGARDQRPDGLHPGPEYQQRIAQADNKTNNAARVPVY